MGVRRPQGPQKAVPDAQGNAQKEGHAEPGRGKTRGGQENRRLSQPLFLGSS